MPHRDLRKWVKKAEEQGWELRGGGRHEKLFPPNGSAPIPLPGKPTKRGLINLRAQLRRGGIDV